MPQGLVLFAHGARDARWAEPFERLRDRVAGAAPQTQVMLAYLEMMQPDLPTAAAKLYVEGCRSIVLVPIFLGQGGHVREDLPRLLQVVASRIRNASSAWRKLPARMRSSSMRWQPIARDN